MQSREAILAAVFALGFLCRAASAQDNTPPAGFEALFNGKNLAGWQGLVELPERAKLTKEALAAKQRDANERYLPHWTVFDGVLRYDGKGQSLQTASDYGDFELFVDWKIGPKGIRGSTCEARRRCRSGTIRAVPAGSTTTKSTRASRSSVRTSPWAIGTRSGS